jgi:2-phosphosulfolactate phosphatase
MKIDVILSPAELPALKKVDLSKTACIVFDVLRATSTFVTALDNGAKAIIPVGTIAEAVAIRKKQPDVLLGGEREGLKIKATQSGSADFDLGNSPREYTREKVSDKTIVSTTTNGTLALEACTKGGIVLAGSFLNLTATSKFLRHLQMEEILMVCAGTGKTAALEDVLAAGALCDLLIGKFTDAAQIARNAYAYAEMDLGAAVCNSENARRLLTTPDLRGDVSYCLQIDLIDLVAVMGTDNAIRVLV